MIEPILIGVDVGENYCRCLLALEPVHGVETQLTILEQLIAQKIVLAGRTRQGECPNPLLLGEGRSGKAAHRQNDNVTMSKASPNKFCDDCGNALTLLFGLLVRGDPDTKSWQWDCRARSRKGNTR